MRPMGIETRIRIRDIVFDIDAAEEDGLMDILMEEMDFDVNNHEEYVADHCLGTFTPDELEYIAHRILDAVAFERQRLDNMTPKER